MRSLALVVLLAPAIAAADPCDTVWPKRDKVTTAQSKECATYWMKHHARTMLVNNIRMGDAYLDDALWRDFTADDFRRMRDHVTVACDELCKDEPFPDGSDLGQAKLYFTVLADAHFSTNDPRDNRSFEPVLRKLLDGERITRAELAFWSPMVLWRLRNAPYARHGRAFKMVDLHKFFYDGPFGLSVNKKFAEKQLDKNDQANVELVVKAIDKKLGLPDADRFNYCGAVCNGKFDDGDCALCKD